MAGVPTVHVVQALGHGLADDTGKSYAGSYGLSVIVATLSTPHSLRGARNRHVQLMSISTILRLLSRAGVDVSRGRAPWKTAARRLRCVVSGVGPVLCVTTICQDAGTLWWPRAPDVRVLTGVYRHMK